MSLDEIKKNIQALDDLVQVPQLRARVEELEAELLRCNREHKQEKGEWFEKRRELIKDYNEKAVECGELQSLRITYGKDKLSLQDMETIVQARFTEENDKKINIQAENLTQAWLPSRVATEISSYPNCKPATKRLI